MKNIIENIKSKRSIHYLLIIAIGLIISIPFLWVQIRTTDDGWLHLLRLIGVDNSFTNGTFPLVAPYFCNNWGYSMTAFYPPIVTFIPYLLGIISGSFSTGLKIFATFATILSGIFMYNFVNETTKKKGIAFFSAIIYMTFPYRLEDVYNRYAIGEFTAFVFIPLVFQGLYNLLHGGKKRHFYIAIGATGLLLSHTISTLYTAVFCVLYILFNAKTFFKKDIIVKCVINGIFILLMSLMFLLPMLEFKSQTEYSIFRPEVMKTGSQYMPDKTIKPWQFLKDKGEENGVSFVVGIPFILMVAIGILVYSKIEKKYKNFYLASTILGIISFVMCTNLFPWAIMPNFLCNIQYPWRMLGFAMFFLSPICAMNIYYLAKTTNRKWLQNLVYIIFIIVIMIFTAIELKTYKTEDKTIDKEYEQNIKENPKIHYFSINRDYMPLKALVKQRTYLLSRSDSIYILSGKAEIIKEEKEALYLEVELQNVEKGTELELPFLFYPGYYVKLQYEDLEVNLETSETENGFVRIVMPEDFKEGKIIVNYTATILDKVAYILSGVFIVVFIIYVICFRKKMQQEDLNSEEKRNE